MHYKALCNMNTRQDKSPRSSLIFLTEKNTNVYEEKAMFP